MKTFETEKVFDHFRYLTAETLHIPSSCISNGAKVVLNIFDNNNFLIK
jgi:hypothetical protein